IKPSNPRLASALTKYPAETWTFEVLQLLPPACAVSALRAAEQQQQQHIERLHTRDPKHGFNILPAVFARSQNQPSWSRTSDGKFSRNIGSSAMRQQRVPS